MHPIAIVGLALLIGPASLGATASAKTSSAAQVAVSKPATPGHTPKLVADLVGKAVTVYLPEGVKLKGTVMAVDGGWMTLQTDMGDQIVNLAAIALITPRR